MPRNCAKDIIDEIEYLLPQELQKHKQIRQKFTDEEDKLIISLVGDNQFPNWNEIAQNIPNKSGRQCRERFQNYLSPDLSKKPWTKEEDELIIRLYKEFGSSWSLIADHFDGKRTNNNIKNRWNGHLKSKFNNLNNFDFKIIKSNEEGNNSTINEKKDNIIINTPKLMNSDNNFQPLKLFNSPHLKRNQNIMQKLVYMNQEPIIRREVQQKVIRQRQQKRLQNQLNEIQNEDYFSNCFSELIGSCTFNQDSFESFNSVFNESSDLDIFNNSF